MIWNRGGAARKLAEDEEEEKLNLQTIKLLENGRADVVQQKEKTAGGETNGRWLQR